MIKQLTVLFLTLALVLLTVPVSAEQNMSDNGTLNGKGVVTIVAAGSQAYYLGDEIAFFGTNTDTNQTYLFVTGPNLKENGSQIQTMNPSQSAVENNNTATFTRIAVDSNRTWSWKWETAGHLLDAGTYTIYAVSHPNDKDHLEKTAYGTVSIIIRRPLANMTASPSAAASAVPGVVTIVAAGDPVHHLGDEIAFSGTNTQTYKTYLFLTGPNMPDNGAYIASLDPQHNPSKDNDTSTFKSVDVNGDHTWSWRWGTSNYALDAGTYTIYAVSQPLTRESLAQAAYGTTSIMILKPLDNTTASASASAVPVATTKKSPGYGILIALTGLGAGAFIILRRR
jgi:hypothetical protein